jgi:hypothetical protein
MDAVFRKGIKGISKPHYNYQNFDPFQNENSPSINPVIKMGVTIWIFFWGLIFSTLEQNRPKLMTD